MVLPAIIYLVVNLTTDGRPAGWAVPTATDIAFALADGERMRMVLGNRLALLPAPAETLELTVERFGPPHRDGRALFDDGAAQPGERLDLRGHVQPFTRA